MKQNVNLIFVQDHPRPSLFTGSSMGHNTNPLFLGQFAFKEKPAEYVDLFACDDYDKSIYGDNCFRYQTWNMFMGAGEFLICKMNIEKGLIYFLTDESKESDSNVFETRGEKLQFIAIYKKELL